jgi:single-stranded DNA-binding protein
MDGLSNSELRLSGLSDRQQPDHCGDVGLHLNASSRKPSKAGSLRERLLPVKFYLAYNQPLESGKDRPMRTINQVTLLGHCGKTPTLNSKKTRLRFSLATTNRFKRDGADSFEEQTDWHEIVVFGERTIGYLVKNLTQGQPVFVAGRLRSYEKPNEDKALRCWEVVAEEVVPLQKTSRAEQETVAAEKEL